MKLSSRQARAMIAAAEAKASELGASVNIAVLDAGAHLKAFSRMDGAVLGSIDVAPAPRLELTNDGLAPFAGGVPLKNSAGELLGAVGISGGAPEQDVEIARAAARAFDV